MTYDMNPPVWRLLWLAGNIAACCVMAIAPVRSQIAADGSLPTQANTGDSANFTIEGGSRVGNNLFHSFREFSVPTGGSAFFNNAADVQNIISRVTGGSISNIDGILKANGSANFFLLNPNGVIFGPNASLEIGGSFVGTTANSLKFADGTEFRASDSTAPPLLTVSVPVGLQFGANPGAIVNRSQATVENSPTGLPVGLQVQLGQTLALVGGEVRLEGGNLTASGGRIELGSVAGNSAVNLNPTNAGFALSYEGVQNFQDIHLSGGAIVDVTSFTPEVGSGNVRVQGRQVILSEGSQIGSFTTGALSSGGIAVTASESVELLGIGTSGDVSFPTSLATTTAADGNAGDLTITAKRLIVRDGAGIFTSSVALPDENPQGGAGNLRVTASESVEISGSAPNVGGSALNVETRTNGDAGTLEVVTGRLILKDGAEVSAATSGAGRGGTVRIVAPEGVELSGSSINNEGTVIPSRLRASSRGAGDAGNLTIATNLLNIRDGAEVTASGRDAGGAGNLEIRASQILLDNGGRLRAETAAGNRGSIQLDSRNIVLRRNSSITTEATGTASGGNIAVSTDTLAALENSKIIANAIQGAGGNIQINTRGIFLSPDSSITASSQFGVSGTVTISNPEVDPSSGLVELPDAVADPSQQIAVACAADDGNSLTVIGRGGLPEDATAALSTQNVWRDWQDFTAESFESKNFSPPNRGALAPQPLPQLVEATGWTLDGRGNVTLVASVPDESTRGRLRQMLNCNRIERLRSDRLGNSLMPNP